MIILGTLIILFCQNIFAQDLGVIGKIYQIAELDLMRMIERRILILKKNGTIDKDMSALKSNGEEFVKRPKGMALPRTKSYKITPYSVIYTVPEDIIDANGKIIYKAGTTVNPLQIRPLSKVLCFFDGDDKVQVDWVIKNCANNINKLILVQGNFLEISNKYKKKFYFDQYGSLVLKFGISALPAIVRQQGKFLYTEEIQID